MAKALSVKAQMIKTKGANDKQPRFYIQSGVLKHLKLIWNAKSSTRPTKSIVKESFFNTMKSEIVDCVFIEGFGGCGSMGIEALSLGASEAVFYEIDTEAYKILCQNLANAKNAAQKLGKILKFSTFNADFFSTDIFTQGFIHTQKAILYLDPPFCIRQGMQDIYERLFALVGNLKPCGVRFIVFEHLSGYNMPEMLGVYIRYKMRSFGKSTLTYYIAKD